MIMRVLIFLLSSLLAGTTWALPTRGTGRVKPKTSPSKRLKERLPAPEKEPGLIEQTDAVEALYPEMIAHTVGDVVVGLANRIDSFFGDPRSDDERNGSTLRLVPSYTFHNDQPGAFEMGVNLNLKLRNLESKAKRLEKSLRDELIDQTPLGDTRLTPKNRKPPKEEEWYFNFESKLAARPALYYSGIFRLRRNFITKLLVHHFSVSGGWDSDDYWTQKTSLVSDRALNEQVLFRFNNEANWFMSRNQFQTNHGPSLIHTINQYNSISYNFRLLAGVLDGAYHHLDSVYSANYRHGTPSKRIFLDLIPSYSYPRTHHYKERRSFEVRLEWFFGDFE